MFSPRSLERGQGLRGNCAGLQVKSAFSPRILERRQKPRGICAGLQVETTSSCPRLGGMADPPAVPLTAMVPHWRPLRDASMRATLNFPILSVGGPQLVRVGRRSRRAPKSTRKKQTYVQPPQIINISFVTIISQVCDQKIICHQFSAYPFAKSRHVRHGAISKQTKRRT